MVEKIPISDWGRGMSHEKRIGQKAVPENLKEILSEFQIMTLNKIAGFGWELMFVRRPLLQEVVPVVRNHEGAQVGVLEKDGRINLEPKIDLRNNQGY